MTLAADHLDKEVIRNNQSASAMKSAAIKLVSDVNPPELASSAYLSYDITIGNMSNNKFQELEWELERAPFHCRRLSGPGRERSP